MKINVLIVLITILSSCTSKRNVVTATKKKEVVKVVVVVEEPVKKKEVVKKTEPVYSNPKEAYIQRYKAIAMKEMRKYKIPASITLAQGLLESGSGQSTLTRKSNNHFGIKCHKGWTGKKTYHDDDEKGECFRVYKDPENSFKDHSLFLAERTRYAGLFQLKITDYEGWAKGLKKAGYATDKAYPQKLINLVETYELYKYDAEVLGIKVKKKKRKTTEVAVRKGKKRDSYTVKKGDTLYSISKRYGLTVDQIRSLNRLRNNDISIGQKLFVSK